MRIGLGAPKGTEFDNDVIGVTNWAGTWQAAIDNARIPGITATESRRARGLGAHFLPTVWEIEGPEEALVVAPDVAASYRIAEQRLQEAVSLAGVVWDDISMIPIKNARTIAAFDGKDWTNAVAVVNHLTTIGVGEATMVRQLAIPGVHSKWIERNATVLGAMLGVPNDRTLGDPLTRLFNHIGLKGKDIPLRVTLACPHLRTKAAGLLRFDATIPILNSSTLCPSAVLVVENLELGHTLPTELPGVAIICGLGSGAPLLAALGWVHAAACVLYWGDIDRAGLAILATVRRAGIRAHAVMMDGTTLDAYPSAQHETDTQMDSDEVPIGLEGGEVDLYVRLNRFHNETGRELQLEQEHIPVAQAHLAITGALRECSTWRESSMPPRSR
ncbi:hypothetical protein NBRGN_065_00380 [Nocardia brasiliensis NBRC 14402]|nr:hypothetical protein NBRGN_065_00380 [Nocardia brasiliensis NBRC 14402]SUB10455.1 Uncharacterized protein conserved in bacteria [Nocardia brasiliensis]